MYGLKNCPTVHVIQYSAGLLYEYDIVVFTELCMIVYPPSSHCRI